MAKFIRTETKSYMGFLEGCASSANLIQTRRLIWDPEMRASCAMVSGTAS
jgi:hypothetical protein